MFEQGERSDVDASTPHRQPWRQWLSTPTSAEPEAAGASFRPFLCDGNCKRLFESDVVGVILGESDGDITEANDAFLDLTGYARADLPLRLETTMSAESGGPGAWDSEALLRSRGAVTWEGEVVAKDGRRVPVMVGAASLTTAGPEYIAFVLDLTRTRRVEVALKQNEQRLLEYQEQLRALTLDVTLAEEQERRRIALGLHDAVGHSLALARMKLQACRRDDRGDLDDELGEVHDLIGDAVRATRALTFELSSPVLYELGLEAALASAGEHVADTNRVRFELESDGKPKPLSTDASVVLYRCAQELLVNAVKHGRAGCVRIQVARVQDRIEIAVVDDGIGFDPHAISERHVRRRGYGLLSIREQLHAIGGHMNLNTAPGQGTRCTLAAPLGSPEA
jgi:PAS domain S-box-containing protein